MSQEHDDAIILPLRPRTAKDGVLELSGTVRVGGAELLITVRVEVLVPGPPPRPPARRAASA